METYLLRTQKRFNNKPKGSIYEGVLSNSLHGNCVCRKKYCAPKTRLKRTMFKELSASCHRCSGELTNAFVLISKDGEKRLLCIFTKAESDVMCEFPNQCQQIA